MHRPGHKHSNADALSCPSCQQCGGASHCETAVVATTSLATEDVEEVRREQHQDAQIEPVLRALEANSKPPANDLKALSPQTRRLFQLWDQLIFSKGSYITSIRSHLTNQSFYNWLFIPPCRRKCYVTCMKVLLKGTLGKTNAGTR